MLKSPQLFENRSRSQPHKIRRHSIICTCVLEDGKHSKNAMFHPLQLSASKLKTLDIRKKQQDRLDWETRQWPLQQWCARYISTLVVEIVDSIQKVGQQMLQLRFFIMSR